eukprot:2940365-Pleurochrysis_carterae.AAC.1
MLVQLYAEQWRSGLGQRPDQPSTRTKGADRRQRTMRCLQKRIEPKNVQNGYRDESRNPSSCELRYRDRLVHESDSNQRRFLLGTYS